MAEIALLIVDRDVDGGASTDSRFGGAPTVDADFSWPLCKFCSGSMQFLGQIRPPGVDRLHLAFMCQNDPGVHWEWDADRGGNAVVQVEVENTRLAELPNEGEVSRPTRYGARIVCVEASDYDAARGIWLRQEDRGGRDILGHVGGEPYWLQGDETPSCDHCSKPMRFVAQLEAGPDHQTEMNFAGGCGYVFECSNSGGDGKFLWQG